MIGASILWRLGAVAALGAALWWVGHSIYDAGVQAERARWQAAQDKAAAAQQQREAEDRDTAAAVITETRESAAEVVAETRTETAAAVERVRYEIRRIEVPVDRPLPALPASVLDEGRAAVARARAAQRVWLPDGPDP